MKQLSSGMAGYATQLLVLFLTIAVLLFGTSEARAYETYSGCENYHDGFRKNPYISLSDGSNWGDNLHNVHRDDMLNGDCDTCHTSSSKSKVFIDNSAGGNGLAVDRRYRRPRP